jgi:hypothetical protein
MPETKRKTTRLEKIVKPSVQKAKVAAPVKTPTGRPTTFNQKTADLICLGLSGGMSLRQILKADKTGTLPAQSTIYEWLIRHPLFAEQYARAREEQADTNADEILDIADEMPPEFTDEKGRTSLDQTYIAWQKQRIEARKWTAMKLKPKKYGDRMAMEGVEGGAAIKTEETSSGRLFEIIRNLEMSKRAG